MIRMVVQFELLIYIYILCKIQDVINIENASNGHVQCGNTG